MAGKADLILLQAQIEKRLREHAIDDGLGGELVDASLGAGRWDELTPGQRLDALKLTTAYLYGKPRESMQLDVGPAAVDEKERRMLDSLMERLRAMEGEVVVTATVVEPGLVRGGR